MATSKEKSQANRAATITGNSAGSVLEDGASIASGLLIVSDLDKGENQVKAIKEKSGEYGKFSISTDGSWTYVLNKNSKDVQELAEGETVTEKFVVTSKDGSASKTVVVTVTGTNDVASIKGDTRATLTEDSRHTTARGELEVKDADQGQSSVQAVASQAGTYGSFSIDNKGHWTYVMDNSRAAMQALAQGEKGTDSFVVWSKDGSASQTVTVTLKGVNDEATITGQDTGSVSEDAAPNTATGKLIVNDVDNGENTVVPITAQAGAYGSFSIVADGSWTYTLDNSLLAVQSLPAGVTLTESFVVWSNDSQLFLNEHDDDEDHDDEEHDSDEDHDDEDGDDRDEECHDDDHAPSYKGASKVVTVTIVGTNDAAVITGSSTGALTEDLSLGVTGQLNVVDIDMGESSFQAQSNTVGTFGSLSIGTDGAWSYALNNGADNVQALAAGETATDTFVVKSYDGTEQQITLTLTGTNDLATISGSSTGALTEDTALATGAALAVADVDHGEAVFQAQAAVAAIYGSFEIGTDGNWTYALNNTATNVQALAAGEQVTDSFTVVSKDGTASQLVTVTITGTNDGPVVSNNAAAAAGAVSEDGTLSVTGQLSASDVDNGATQAWSVLGGANGEYGAIGIDAASGQWIYNLNNDAANVQALAAGQSQTETFTVRVTDDQGATADQQVSVTVTGDNDGPVVSEQDVLGSVLAVAQAGSAPVTKPIEFTVQQYLGHQSNSLADLRGYAASHTANYTVQTNVIDYTDDPAGFSGELPGSSRWPAAQAQNVTGTGGVNNVFFARITADFSVGTADTYTFRTFNDDGVFLLIDNTLVISDTGYHPEYAFTGSIALTPGNHTIELFFFENGGEASLEFSARTSTSSYGLVGSSGGGFSGGATQVTDTGLISFSDVDLTDVHLVSAAGTPIGDTLGSLSAVKTSDTTGSGTGGEIKWTYTAPNSALVYLAEGQTKVESFTITLNDQHGGVVTKQIDVTLTGTNDVASISGVAAAQVAEDSTASVGGTLTVADQDQGEAQAQSIDSQLGNYGSFSVDANGNWTYDWPLHSLDGKGGPGGKGGAAPGAEQAYQARSALAAGETGTDTFTVTSLDGTATQDVVVTVVGANDAASFYGQAYGEVTEDVMLGTAGTLSVQDVDHDQAHSQAAAVSGNFGDFNVDANGNWTYELAQAPAADGKGGPSAAYSNLQALAAGQTATETFAVTSLDGTATQDVSIVVVGSNDAAAIAGTSTGTVAEDSTLTTSGALVVTDVDASEAQFQAQANVTGAHGTFNIDASGRWTYTLDNAAADVQALDTGESLTDSFTVRSLDGTANQVVTVGIDGLDDHVAPVAVDDTVTGTVTKSAATVSFDMSPVEDYLYSYNSDTNTESYLSTVDSEGFRFSSISSNNGDGPWMAYGFGLDNSQAVKSYANATSTAVPIVMARADGAVFDLDSANITRMGTAGQSYVETVTGYLNGQVVAQESFDVPDALWGTAPNQVSLASSGFNAVDKVTFELKNAASSNDYFYQFLDNLQVGNNIVTPLTEDTATNINVLANDTDGNAGDTLSVVSFANVSAQGVAITQNADGSLHYDPTQVAGLQALAAGETLIDTLTYSVQDQTGLRSNTATVSVVLQGVNDAPVLQGTLTEQLYTSSLSVWTPFLVNNGVWVTPTGASSGDMVPHTFVRQFTAAQDGNYEFQFAVDNEGSVLVDGVAIAGLFNNDWAHSTVQTVALTAGIHTVTMNALNWGGPAAFAMNIKDPNNQEIWNTRTHLDPEPLILSYTENQAAMVVSAGLTLTDIDSANMTHATVAVGAGFAAGEDVLGFANQNGITGVYDANTGVLSLSGSATQAQYQAALRSVTYSNSSDSPSTADRTINFTVDDGSGQSNLSNTVQSKIVVMAVNDAATISGASSGSVTEDTTLTASGSLTVSDADAGQAQFQVQTNAAGAHGTFNIDANGQWTYTLDNVATEVQALDTGNSLSDSFTVLSLDGTASQVVIVGINGLDDNQKPVAVNDTLQQISGSGVVIGFEAGTFTQSGYYTVVSNGFTFTPQNTTGTYNGIQAYGPNISSGWGYNNSYSLYSYAYSGSGTNPSLTTMPIEMVRTDGSVFALDKANITGYNGNQTGTMLETVTGYLNGVQVAQESFTVVNSSTGTRNSLVDLTATGFNAVDRVEFKLTLSNSTSTNPHQWIDNIALGGTMVNLLANDSDPDAGATLSINSYDAVSTLGASVAVSSSGVVTYNASNVASVKALAAGETAVDTFTYDVKDQFGAVSNRANVTYTVTGSNDVATLSGTTTGSVKEDVTASATGRVLVTDADHDQSFAKVVSGTSAYGSYSVDVNGNWSYSLNNNLASVQALSATQTVSDSFTVTSADGSATQQVTMSIAGTNDAPVVANDTISGGLLTFEPGTTTNLGSSVITGDFTFTGTNMYLTSYYGANSSYCLYSYSYGSSTTAPITMKRTDGGVFSIETANITGYNYQTAQYDTETITGYRGGVKVAQQVVSVLDSSFGARNNTVTLTDPGFNSVDQVVFSLAGSSYYYLYQWLDNISVPNSVAKVSNVNVLANDTDKDSGAVLSIGSFSATSAHGAAISLNADGTLHYDPTISAELQAVSKGVSVQDSFTYQAQDQFGVLSNTATVEVTLVGIA